MKVRIEKYIEYNVVGFLIFTLFSDLKKVYFNITFEVVLKYTFLRYNFKSYIKAGKRITLFDDILAISYL